jgi:protein-L-isoaspartate(D-aspartate) O-methyltransferase
LAKQRRASLREVRLFYARQMALASNCGDERLERAFAEVRREDFLPPGPWRIGLRDSGLQTPSADPAYIYQNCLVALDEAKAINNGEPFLHAAWLGAVQPIAGDLICQVGVGLGYYTAILSRLAAPRGRVTAFEIEEHLAAGARQNLKRFRNVEVVCGDATKVSLPECDLIYVNAGVAAPPVSWLQSLRPQGRMIFPWRPSDSVALTLLVTRRAAGFDAKALMPVWFIPCIGASDTRGCSRVPDPEEARNVRSVWLSSERLPDDSAIAVFPDIWLSSSALD